MDLKLIQRLMAMMKRGGVAELDIEDPATGMKLRLKREGAASPSQAPVIQLVQGGAPAMMHASPMMGMPMSSGGAAPASGAPAEPAPRKEPVGTPFPSPMVGTFYRSASPESEPFVQVGKRVNPDSTLCIIEAMKVMNEIKSEMTGEIVEILVENGEPVEFGQPLFLVKTS